VWGGTPLAHLIREGLSDKESFERRPEFSQEGGALQMQGQSILTREKTEISTCDDQLRSPV
jgi:hypothetical protein